MTGSGVAPYGGYGYAFVLLNSGDGNAASTTYIDDVTATTNGGSPAIDLGTSNAQTINIGNAEQQGATNISKRPGRCQCYLGARSTVNLGNGTGASATAIQGGTGNISINTGRIRQYRLHHPPNWQLVERHSGQCLHRCRQRRCLERLKR